MMGMPPGGGGGRRSVHAREGPGPHPPPRALASRRTGDGGLEPQARPARLWEGGDGLGQVRRQQGLVRGHDVLAAARGLKDDLGFKVGEGDMEGGVRRGPVSPPTHETHPMRGVKPSHDLDDHIYGIVTECKVVALSYDGRCGYLKVTRSFCVANDKLRGAVGGMS